MTITTVKHKTPQNVVINLEIKLLKEINLCVLIDWQWLWSVSKHQTQRRRRRKKKRKGNRKPTTTTIMNQTYLN
jgi:hypothetical protein